IDPIALARELLASFTQDQLGAIASLVDLQAAQDIRAAIQGAADASDTDASWACWEAAAALIKPIAPRLAKHLKARQMQILQLVSRGHEAWKRGQG
ncbi:hypothetical protein RZS08_26935, partial [Arthrospira platensis SPKY1]|nr:hypothetical protein [Arthrospira platensis SPKY1]